MNMSSERLRLFRTLKSPLSVQVEVTGNCNHRCTHCYNYWKKGDKYNCSQNMQLELAKKIADEVISSEVFSVILTGGEPFLNFEVVKYFTTRFKKAGISVSINSNLTLITEEMIDELKEANVAGVLTSILGASSKVHDSITSTKGSYERLIQALKLCAQKKLPVTANMVVTKENICDIENVAKLVKSLGCADFTCLPAMPPICDRSNRDKYLLKNDIKNLFNNLILIRKQVGIDAKCLIHVPYCFVCELSLPNEFDTVSCGAGVTSCIISFDGSVRACPFSNKTYGSLLNENLSKLWQKLDDWRTVKFVPSKCRKCKLLGECVGGCRYQASIYDDDHRLDADNPLMVADNEDIAYNIFENMQSYNDFSEKEFLSDTKIVFNNFSIRKEDFGGVLYNGGRLLVDESSYEFLSKVVPNMEYQAKDYEVYEELFKLLIASGFAKINP